MGNVLDLKVSKDAVLEIYELYAQKHACAARAMQDDCDNVRAYGDLYKKSIHWKTVMYIDSQIEEKLMELNEQGKTLVAYKIRHALALSSLSPSRLLKVLEVCGVQYDS